MSKHLALSNTWQCSGADCLVCSRKLANKPAPMTLDPVRAELIGLAHAIKSMNHTESVEAIEAYANIRLAQVLYRLKTPTITDVFPDEVHETTYSDMMKVVNYYNGLIEAERIRLEL